jgi:L-ribulose-5-phosphate 3-epimerase
MKIGVMQGRLLPKYNGRYQAHPLGYWKDEFRIAKEIGLDSIEFILDYNDYMKNPLMSENGIKEILKTIEQSGVKVNSICADFFMEAPLHSNDDNVRSKSIEVLNKLIKCASIIGASDIVIPCVDESSLKTDNDQRRFELSLNNSIKNANKHKINLALETDLGPEEFKALIDKFDNENITVNYDTGNSASLGYDIDKEFKVYGHKISDIHIKDRVLNGGPVILGTGNVNFNNFLKNLEIIDFKGPIIMQAYRDDEGVEIFKKQLKWFKSLKNDSNNSC